MSSILISGLESLTITISASPTKLDRSIWVAITKFSNEELWLSAIAIFSSSVAKTTAIPRMNLQNINEGTITTWGFYPLNFSADRRNWSIKNDINVFINQQVMQLWHYRIAVYHSSIWTMNLLLINTSIRLIFIKTLSFDTISLSILE